MEWVEVQAKTVDEAVDLAVKELGVASRDQVNVEVLQEPKVGFLGLGRQEALVKVTPKPKEPKKRRRRRRKRGGGEQSGSRPQKGEQQKQAASGSRQPSKQKSQQDRKPREDRRPPKERKPMKPESSDKPSASIEEQADVAKEFIGGLIHALGLEGTVATRIDGDVLYVDVAGDQTEALVGPKGATMQALHELTRTVIQRKTFGAPRLRVDVAGYTERRRAALGIYAGKLAQRVLDAGEEIMLEPMNPADRKVVHDAVVEIEGVTSFSEGEDPNRAVVLAPDPDAPAPAPRAEEDTPAASDDDTPDDGTVEDTGAPGVEGDHDAPDAADTEGDDTEGDDDEGDDTEGDDTEGDDDEGDDDE